MCKKDKRLSRLMALTGKLSIELDDDYFCSLVGSIIGQQLSVKAAGTIYERAKVLCSGFTPESISAVSEDELRSIGISRPKVRYLKDLAEKTQTGEVKMHGIELLSDNEIAERLTSVKGIGQWTAEMFLIFSLGRPDVLSKGDLGIKRAIKWLYKLKAYPSAEYLEKCSKRWKPYRTAASMYLWEAINRGFVDNFKDLDEAENQVE